MQFPNTLQKNKPERQKTMYFQALISQKLFSLISNPEIHVCITQLRFD